MFDLIGRKPEKSAGGSNRSMLWTVSNLQQPLLFSSENWLERVDRLVLAAYGTDSLSGDGQHVFRPLHNKPFRSQCK